MPKTKIRKLALSSVVLTTLFLASLLIARSGFESKQKSKSLAAPSPAAVAPTTASASKQPDDGALAKEIDRAIDESDLTRLRRRI